MFQAQLAVGRMSNATGSNGRSGVWGKSVGGLEAGDASGLKTGARGGLSGLVSDVKTYADMISAESGAACKHV